MSADARRVRRARVAIYGPVVVGVLGLIVAMVGAIGLAVTRHSGPKKHEIINLPAPPAPAVSARNQFLLVGADARLYPRGDLAHPRTIAAGGRIVDAAAATKGGVWLATASGNVYASGADELGGVKLGKHAAPIVGIADAPAGLGYRLVAADGHVYPVGVPDRGQYTLDKPGQHVVGIAATSTDGYWIALSDGTVSPFAAPTLGRFQVKPGGAPVVGIAASLDGSGYWLVTADGRVHAFGVPFRGDLAHAHVKARVVAIAAGAQDGYWLTTADGKVYPFAAPTFVKHPGSKPRAPIVAIVPY